MGPLTVYVLVFALVLVVVGSCGVSVSITYPDKNRLLLALIVESALCLLAGLVIITIYVGQ